MLFAIFTFICIMLVARNKFTTLELQLIHHQLTVTRVVHEFEKVLFELIIIVSCLLPKIVVHDNIVSGKSNLVKLQNLMNFCYDCSLSENLLCLNIMSCIM